MLWIIIVGLVAGLIARWLSPGPNNPQGFILTIVLGIAGAFLSTFVGQAIGWYRPDQGAGFIAATIGADVAYEISGTLENAVAHAASDAAKDGAPGAVVMLSPENSPDISCSRKTRTRWQSKRISSISLDRMTSAMPSAERPRKTL